MKDGNRIHSAVTAVICAAVLSVLLCADLAKAAQTSMEAVVSASLKILCDNEGGYSSVNPDDNGALSVGKLQWHGWRALSLLQTIVNADDAQAKTLLGNALYKEITTNDASKWGVRKLTAEEAAAIKKLLDTDAGRTAQDELGNKDITTYIEQGQRLGITNGPALVYFADLANQGGAGAAGRVSTSASKIVGSYAAVTLNELHEAAICDSVMGAYAARRFHTYKYAAGLGWEYCNTGDSYIPDDHVSAKGIGAAWIQRSLNACMNARLTVTEIYDEPTKNAVMAFQSAKSLSVDGIAGKATIAALIKSVVENEKINMQEPTKPSEPENPEKPTVPAIATEPMPEPTKPTAIKPTLEPTKPSETIKPNEPTKSTKPSEPVKPTEPTKSTKPSEPVKPTEPTAVKPTPEPTKPSETIKPNEPTKSTKPSETVKPTEPTAVKPTPEPTEPTAVEIEREKTVLEAAKKSYAVNDNHAAFQLQITSSNKAVPVTYASSNPAAAKVSPDGRVTPKGAGQAKITASQAQDKTHTAAKITISITVYSTKPSDYPMPAGALYAGKTMQKQHVQWLQAALVRLVKAPVTVNGIWSKKMTKQVTGFQKKCNIPADGIAGSQTKELVGRMLAVKAKKPSVTVKSDGTVNTVSWKKFAKANRVYIYREESDGSYKRIKTIKAMSKTSFRDKTAVKDTAGSYMVKYAFVQHKIKIVGPPSITEQEFIER